MVDHIMNLINMTHHSSERMECVLIYCTPEVLNNHSSIGGFRENLVDVNGKWENG